MNTEHASALVRRSPWLYIKMLAVKRLRVN